MGSPCASRDEGGDEDVFFWGGRGRTGSAHAVSRGSERERTLGRFFFVSVVFFPFAARSRGVAYLFASFRLIHVTVDVPGTGFVTFAPVSGLYATLFVYLTVLPIKAATIIAVLMALYFGVSTTRSHLKRHLATILLWVHRAFALQASRRRRTEGFALHRQPSSGGFGGLVLGAPPKVVRLAAPRPARTAGHCLLGGSPGAACSATARWTHCGGF